MAGRSDTEKKGAAAAAIVVSGTRPTGALHLGHLSEDGGYLPEVVEVRGHVLLEAAERQAELGYERAAVLGELHQCGPQLGVGLDVRVRILADILAGRVRLLGVEQRVVPELGPGRELRV